MTRNESGLFDTLRRTRVMSAFAAAIAIIAIIGSIPAAAAPHTIYTPGYAAGSARFKEHGDHIYLCDHAPDGHSVAVKLNYTNQKGKHKEYWRWNWWGAYKYNGCKDINLGVKEDTFIGFKVCLGDHGRPGGKTADVIKRTCSDTRWVFNDH